MSPWLVVAAALLSQVPDAGSAEAPPLIHLGVGTQKVLTFPGVTHVAVGDPKLVEVKVLGSTQFLLVGQAYGETSLLLFRDNKPHAYTVRVRKHEGCGISEIKQILGPSQTLTARMIGDRVFIDGKVGTTEELDRLVVLFDLYPKVVKNLATLDPRLVAAKVAAVNDALLRQGLRGVKAVALGEDMALEGAVTEESDRQKAQALADEIFGPLRHGVAALRKAKPAP